VVLAALAAVDYVCLFGEDTPLRLIKALRPDVLVKGADWKKEDIVGASIVLGDGGSVRRIRLTPGRSTTSLIHRIRDGRRGRARHNG
jgi:D-beta-D-heptose 7-phosphate kinase/D-beta-D-heptose 1-phosphate adenosyltransferase